MTTLDSFSLFLDGIKKERTTVVSISTFNRLINEVQLDWFKARAPENDLEQSVIDDLSQLKVITDGYQTWKGITLAPISANPNSKIFSYPIGTYLPTYPRYYRLQSVQFRMAYKGNSGLYSDVEDYEYARVLRSDKKAVMPRNYYRRAKKGRLYYELVGNVVRCVSEEDCIGSTMMLEYLRYPEKIWLDETLPADHTSQEVAIYTAGYGSVPCEFPDMQTKEIISLAVLKHLERTMDQRFGTYAQGEKMN
jgi:hypothetical protein